MKFTLTDDVVLDASKTMLIPLEMDIQSVDLSQIKAVLVIEKDAIFQYLSKSELINRNPWILLVTGKGYPDVATRQFLNRVSSVLKLDIHHDTLEYPNVVYNEHNSPDILSCSSERCSDELTGFNWELVSGNDALKIELRDAKICENYNLIISSASIADNSVYEPFDIESIQKQMPSKDDSFNLEALITDTAEYEPFDIKSIFESDKEVSFNSNSFCYETFLVGNAPIDIESTFKYRTQISSSHNSFISEVSLAKNVQYEPIDMDLIFECVSSQSPKIFCLVDCDPFGFEIFLTYVNGSKVKLLYNQGNVLSSGIDL